MPTIYFVVALSLLCSASVFALEALPETSLSKVTGQANGIRFTSEFGLDKTAELLYIDDNGTGTNARAGTLGLEFKAKTHQGALVSEVRLKRVNNKNAVVLSTVNAPIQFDALLKINDQSVFQLGQGPIHLAQGERIDAVLYPGGRRGSGLTLDLHLPKSLKFNSYMMDLDSSATLSQTVSLADDRPNHEGGLQVKGLTLDMVEQGLQVGLGRITGSVGFLNARLGEDVMGSSLISDINVPDGSWLRLSQARDQGDIGARVTAYLMAGTSFTLAQIPGVYSTSSSAHSLSARVSLPTAFYLQGLRLNVDGTKGLVFDFDQNEGQAGARIHVQVDDIHLRPARQFLAQNTGPASTSLGALDIKLNLTNKSYLHVRGH